MLRKSNTALFYMEVIIVLVTLAEAKDYLRVDTADEDTVIGTLLTTAERLCCDVARLTDGQWYVINSEMNESVFYTSEELARIRELMKVAVLYAVAYTYEHREKADYHDLALTLRSLLFAVREGAVG